MRLLTSHLTLTFLADLDLFSALDVAGRQFDKDGNLVQWWDDVVIARFKERAQCIIDQYSNYTLPEVNMQVECSHCGVVCVG